MQKKKKKKKKINSQIISVRKTLIIYYKFTKPGNKRQKRRIGFAAYCQDDSLAVDAYVEDNLL
ncbi:hypothetical protein ABIE50_003434 [Chitinophaga sp. OAE865]